MRTIHLKAISFLAWGLIAAPGYADTFVNEYCNDILTSLPERAAWNHLSEDEKNQVREKEMFTPSADHKIERRPIYKTSGLRENASNDIDPADFNVDSADPSLVMPITYPNGVTKYRINFSGMRFIEAGSPAELFTPGVGKVMRSRGFYRDGTEMTGNYHNEAWPWDVVIYKNDRGEQVALGGVMAQDTPGKLPNVSKNNQSRSRWWGKVEHIKVQPNIYEERIIWQGPVHDFNSPTQEGWVYHGYGGTLVTQFNPLTGIHEPIKTENGNYILIYERVIQEWNGQPWITTTFAREMDPSLTHTVGPEVDITNMLSPATGQIFDAFRRGSKNNTTGFLREGDNVLFEKNWKQFVKAGSGNDYVRKYGVYLDYREPGQDVMGKFKNVMDRSGQLIDFASTLQLREIFDGTWVGRPQMQYDPEGNLWLAFHLVRKKTIPFRAPRKGWPSANDFPYYGRVTALFPIRIIHDKYGQPLLVTDIEPKFAYKYKIQRKKNTQ